MTHDLRLAVPLTERLAGLAEECSELSQAALKYRRALTGINPTPVDEETCYDRLMEEIADVMLYLETLYLNKQQIKGIQDQKRDRWLSRLEQQSNG